MKQIEKLKKLNVCEKAVEWLENQPDWQIAWNNCERGDWMLWLLAKLSGSPETKNRMKLTLVACECARFALPFVEKGEKRPLKAIETAEKWTRGEPDITYQMVRSAAYTAHTAYNTWTACALASYAAAHAAYSAVAAAAYAAVAAEDVADAYAVAAAPIPYAWAADANTKTQILKQCADIVRKHYPELKY